MAAMQAMAAMQTRAAFRLAVLSGLLALCAGTVHWEQEEINIHPRAPYSENQNTRASTRPAGPTAEQVAKFWHDKSMKQVESQLAKKQITTKAKNLILFLGDGMSIPTLAASRVYIQGENAELSFDKFPGVGLSKTYCVDSQVADSACSSTAYLCGVKANLGTMGLTAAVPRGHCEGQMSSENNVDSILAWAQAAGKSTGVVTTTRVTHASPGGTYAHIADRDWESDSGVVEANYDSTKCKDIAQQLVYDAPGKNINVVLGGGKREFVPTGVYAGTGDDAKAQYGRRKDGKDLTNEWKTLKGDKGQYVENRDSLLSVDTSKTDYLLGLFDASHVKYNLDRDKAKTPSLKEMTLAAIKMLKKNDKGFYLFVEGGRIDLAHHDALAHYALEETKEFSEAIQAAVDMTSQEDTLIVVTSDHAHTMSMAGYAKRGNDIFKYAGESKNDKLPYTTLAYANGPGYKTPVDNKRPDPENESTGIHPDSIKYKYPSAAPLDSETHGGDDVGIFAHGPWSHLFNGVLEQSTIPHVMAYAAKIGPYAGSSDINGASTASAGVAVVTTLCAAVLAALAALARV